MPYEWHLMHPPYRKLKKGERTRCTQLYVEPTMQSVLSLSRSLGHSFQYQFDPLTGLCIRFVRACQPEEYDLKLDDEVGDHYDPPGLHPDRLTDAALQHKSTLANYHRPGTASSSYSTSNSRSSSSSPPGYAATSETESLSPMFKSSHDEVLFQCDTPLSQSFLSMDDIMNLRPS